MYLLKTAVAMVVTLTIPLTAAAWPKWADRSAEFLTCKNAVQKEFSLPRNVNVSDTYWVKEMPDRHKRLLLNANFGKTPMRGTCELNRRGRLANIEVTPGRFVGPGRVTIEVAEADAGRLASEGGQ